MWHVGTSILEAWSPGDHRFTQFGEILFTQELHICLEKALFFIVIVNLFFFSSSLQSLKEGLTAEQRLHLFENKDTKEFWQWRVVSSYLAACLEAHYIF